MRPPTKALLVVLGALSVSHLIAITTESQAAAQASWLLVSMAALTALVALGDAFYWGVRRMRQ